MLAGEEKYEEIKQIPLDDRVLFLEQNFPDKDMARIETLDTVPPPRAVKTHLPYRFVRRWIEEDNVKTIITTRNPKDGVVSMFHFYKSLKCKYKQRRKWNKNSLYMLPVRLNRFKRIK